MISNIDNQSLALDRTKFLDKDRISLLFIINLVNRFSAFEPGLMRDIRSRY